MRQNQVATIQPSIDVARIRNERWQRRKMMPLFWLHWLHAPSLVSIGQSKLKLLSGNLFSIFSYCDFDLNHRNLGSNPLLRLDVSYPNTKFGVNRPNQTKVIERKLNFYLSNSDLDLNYRHLVAIPICVMM